MTVQRIKELQRKFALDILFLMETKNDETMILKSLDFLEYENKFFVSPHSPGGGGLSLFWKKEINITISSSCNNYIDTTISYKTNLFAATFLYSEPDQSKRKEVWNELTNLTPPRDIPWFITGDFNEITDNSEKSGGPIRPEGSFGDFRAFLSQCDLYDLQHSGNHFSWRGVRGSHLVHCRLDRAMSNSKWSELYPGSRCSYLHFEGSDHRPVISVLDPGKKN